jgi:hypothetical protein
MEGVNELKEIIIPHEDINSDQVGEDHLVVIKPKIAVEINSEIKQILPLQLLDQGNEIKSEEKAKKTRPEKPPLQKAKKTRLKRTDKTKVDSLFKMKNGQFMKRLKDSKNSLRLF